LASWRASKRQIPTATPAGFSAWVGRVSPRPAGAWDSPTTWVENLPVAEDVGDWTGDNGEIAAETPGICQLPVGARGAPNSAQLAAAAEVAFLVRI